MGENCDPLAIQCNNSDNGTNGTDGDNGDLLVKMVIHWRSNGTNGAIDDRCQWR
jgi:hypothetical protein